MEGKSAKAPGCSKCSGEMETGFLLDRAHVSQMPALWIAGVPEAATWGRGVKVADKRAYWVETWRCKSCGYLESYGERPAE
jgi:hypothetical protein